MSDNTNAATPREVREYLLTSELPEGVTVGARGRLSKPAKEFFTARTGREILEPVAASASAE